MNEQNEKNQEYQHPMPRKSISRKRESFKLQIIQPLSVYPVLPGKRCVLSINHVALFNWLCKKVHFRLSVDSHALSPALESYH